MNYEIGRRIVQGEQGGADRAQYGKEIIKELAARLTSDFGNGFSKSNLEYMRRFYLAYPGRNIQIAQTLSGRFPGLEKSTIFLNCPDSVWAICFARRRASIYA
jgi:hypothetical protein